MPSWGLKKTALERQNSSPRRPWMPPDTPLDSKSEKSIPFWYLFVDFGCPKQRKKHRISDTFPYMRSRKVLIVFCKTKRSKIDVKLIIEPAWMKNCDFFKKYRISKKSAPEGNSFCSNLRISQLSSIKFK